MDSGDESGERTAAVAERPPSVSEVLWNAVPAALRQEFLEAAAMNLRRGIHPEETVSKMLEDNGIKRPVVAPPPARQPSGRPVPPRPRPPMPHPAARPQPPRTTERPPSGQAQASTPLHPFGSVAPPAAGDTPRGVIGAAVHKAQRLQGRPGKAAAAAEASVLAAIVRDPAYALSFPDEVRALGARVPAKVAAEIAPLVAQEAERVIEDIRRRAALGDPAAARWIDPDGWSYHLDDEEAPHLARR